MLICALAVVPIVFAAKVDEPVGGGRAGRPRGRGAPGLVGELFTLASDMFPRQAVGSVVGIGGMAGAVGGMLIAKLTGYILRRPAATCRCSSSPAFAYLVGAGGHPPAGAKTEPVNPAGRSKNVFKTNSEV